MIVKQTIAFNILFAIASSTVFAQQGDGSCCGRRMHFDADNAAGWMLMSQAERDNYHKIMLSSKTYEDCLMIQQEHHDEMVRRADSRGVKLAPPRQNACERMKQRGFYN